MTGSDIRRYRRAIGWSQAAFAQEIGLSQSALSLIEVGKIAVSEEHIDQFKKAFDKAKFKPKLSEFLKSLERDRAEGHAALTAPQGRYLGLTIWAWKDDFDLSQAPEPHQSVGLITVRLTDKQAIAFQMNKKTEAWEQGEIFVFEECRREEVRDGDVCLVQVKSPSGRGTNTMITLAHLAPATRGQTLQFEPVSPAGAIFLADENLVACLRAIFRGRYCT